MNTPKARAYSMQELSVQRRDTIENWAADLMPQLMKGIQTVIESWLSSRYNYEARCGVHICIGCNEPEPLFFASSEEQGAKCMSCAHQLRRVSERTARTRQFKRATSDRHDLDTRGRYVDVVLAPDDFYYPMARSNGRVSEHRLVMAKHLGRCLQPWEVVHHKNGNRQDNRLVNLELSTANTHIADHSKGYNDGRLKGLRDGRTEQVQELKKEIQRLKGNGVP